MPREHRPDPAPDSSPRGTLWLIKAALLVIGLGLCVAGRRVGSWPLVTWGMFSRLTPKFPPGHVSAVELRVIGSHGEFVRVAPLDLFPMDRAVIADSLFARAFDKDERPLRNADRTYLEGLIRRRLPEVEPRSIQGWRLHWEVNPRALPPLHRDDPSFEPLGSFTASLQEAAGP